MELLFHQKELQSLQPELITWPPSMPPTWITSLTTTLSNQMDKRWPNSLLDSPTNLVLHPNGAVVPSEDAAILAARAHNLAAQATHIDLLAKNSLYVPFGYPAPATKESLGFALALINAVNFIDVVVKMIDDLLKVLFSSGDAAANEVAALQAARTKLVTTKADLQAVNDNLATKEAVILKAAAKAALLSNSGLNTPAGYSTAPTTMGSPLSLNLVTYPNGAIVPTEGADILAARASHQAAHNALKADSADASASFETDQTVDLVTDGV